ncbi:hypothetical protein GCM10011609_84800 [Lentzea pudingi]|uniref:Uncharacterized protein n=1 Tax=Lentzea pudingi TaxID=1789439 RepID=A0ABQ2IRZ1_9PSEU|nr:hypothetical protein GCM10011609_84800 [Lentzea pudingi]
MPADAPESEEHNAQDLSTVESLPQLVADKALRFPIQLNVLTACGFPISGLRNFSCE